jgi:hypothetical protein
MLGRNSEMSFEHHKKKKYVYNIVSIYVRQHLILELNALFRPKSIVYTFKCGGT